MTRPASDARDRSRPAPPASADIGEPAARVLRRFRLIFNAVKSHFREVEKQAGVAGAQLWALSVIAARPGLGVNDLARAMDVHQSTASNLVRTLLDRQMVYAEKKDTDRRAVQLRLRPAGAKVLRHAPGPFAGVLPQALARLDAEQLLQLDVALASLVELLEADERSQRIPLGQG